NMLKAQMETLTLPQLISGIIEAINYAEYLVRSEGQIVAQERLENLAQLVAAAERQHGEVPSSQSLQQFLDQLALLSPQDEVNWQNEVVTLITAHSAKGLEFPVVFIVGLEEGLFPHSRSLENSWQIEEERRLLYVALTRAKDHAFLTYAQRRSRLTGNWNEAKYAPTMPSRFLNEVPLNLVEEWKGVPTPQGFLRMKEAAFAPTKNLDVREIIKGIQPRKTSELVSQRKQIGELKKTLNVDQVRIGMRVRHREFGIGTIVEIEPDEKLPIVTISFDDPSVGKKRLALEFAPLELLP
ncbi:MAG: ATP-binding domain-containing protein, partial [Armatimonadetes bacterium]|nr:ATP-binding domain-containing protein [Armatimonadota bacterium]